MIKAKQQTNYYRVSNAVKSWQRSKQPN